MTSAPADRPPVAVLIATKNREELLIERALSSVRRQISRPVVLVLVNDGAPYGERVWEELRTLSQELRVVALDNRRTPGAAGAWNSGLDELLRLGHRGFVALLDDDDEWDATHLAKNGDAAAAGANVAVSGLRLCVHGRERPRPLLRDLRDCDFLVGNGGWQGSNTFVDLALMLKVGGFREELPSLNDRDLAIRLLRERGTRWTLVPEWTATWHLGTPGSLSECRAPAKLAGLRAFWRIYGGEMTAGEVEAFFTRAKELFGFGPEEIFGSAAALKARGSLHAAAE